MQEKLKHPHIGDLVGGLSGKVRMPARFMGKKMTQVNNLGSRYLSVRKGQSAQCRRRTFCQPLANRLVAVGLINPDQSAGVNTPWF